MTTHIGPNVKKVDDGPERWINRDLSLIAFNERVLAQVQDLNLPLFDRVKFLAIVAGNLDEFFMVRMAFLRRAAKTGQGDIGPDGMTPRQILEMARERARELLRKADQCWAEDVMPALRASSIAILAPEELFPDETEFLIAHFREQVLPVLTPMVLDSAHPFPLLSTGAIYILLRVSARADAEKNYFSKADTLLVQVPTGLDRFIRLPDREGIVRFILLEDVVTLFAGEIVHGYDIESAHHFRITRDAELTLDEDFADDLLMAIQEGLKRSRWGAPVRLSVGSKVPDAEARYLCERLGLDKDDVFHSVGMLSMRNLFSLVAMIERADLLEPPWPPQNHPAFAGNADLFRVIAAKDVILSMPYQSFDPVTRLIATAADDPDVLAIKITLYRVSGQSPLVRALIRAAEQKKQVTALVELQARFDEEANITWAQRLDAAGAHVVYGVVGYKTHSKAVLIIRREEGGIRRYCHLATGNYNDRTARQYTDLGLLTADPDFGADLSSFFNVITGYSLPPVWNYIEMAPTGLRARTIAMIRREVEKHSPERPGFIRAKMNALIDPQIIRELYRASQAGVKINLLIRGMCRLRPGVPGLSESIAVRSIVDRFLEHSRIFHYNNGGDEEIYLSSADWMERNMDRRLELLFPVNDPDCRREVLAVLDAGFSDNVSAWELLPDGMYAREKPAPHESIFRSQQRLYERAVAMNTKSRDEKRHNVFSVRTAPTGRKRK